MCVKSKLIITSLQGHICRVGQNRIYAPCMTVYLVTSLPDMPYIHRIYMVLANPTHLDYLYPDVIGITLLLSS